MCKTSMKHLQIYNFFLKTLFSWPLSTTNTWKFFKNLTTLLKFQNRPSAPWGRRQGKISWRTISCWKAFLWSQNENRAFLWTFLFHLCLLTGIFNLERQIFCLVNHRMVDARQPICLTMDFFQEGVKSFVLLAPPFPPPPQKKIIIIIKTPNICSVGIFWLVNRLWSLLKQGTSLSGRTRGIGVNAQ